MKRLMLAALALALAGPLSACAGLHPTAPGSTAVSDRLARIEADYANARAFVQLFLPFASEQRQAEVRAIEAAIERALARARAAATIADRLIELGRAEAKVAELNTPE